MKYRTFLITTLLFLVSAADAVAQCPMCRMSAESNLKDGGKFGLGLNAGILYMLFMPYILVAVIGYWWYKNRHKTQVTDQAPNEI
jgi:hypothetical protein